MCDPSLYHFILYHLFAELALFLLHSELSLHISEVSYHGELCDSGTGSQHIQNISQVKSFFTLANISDYPLKAFESVCVCVCVCVFAMLSVCLF